MFRGREITYTSFDAALDRMAEDMSPIAIVERDPKLEAATCSRSLPAKCRAAHRSSRPLRSEAAGTANGAATGSGDADHRPRQDDEDHEDHDEDETKR